MSNQDEAGSTSYRPTHVHRPGLAFEGDALVPSTEFDFDQIDRALDPLEPLPADEVSMAGEAIGKLCRWFAESRGLRSVGLKAVAMTWALRPDLFGEHTAAQLAKRFGVSRACLSKHIKILFHLTNGMTTPSIRGAEYRARRAAIAMAQHRRGR